ncbi:hypothetical protein [Zhongshania sp. BJYM1]|uniref:hypothetical protein n=1 Tax=Zhongshania aquatica TaxID=2965069 RepID=UPI0022B57098|nr:hypothetical protein [Marortus sp. BJYM1]
MERIPALDWIIDYLDLYEIPYLVCGGLAAQAYGSKRKLADIDLYIPDSYISQVSSMGADYITFGPAHHVGEKWDLTYVQFEYEGQKVEIGSDKECRIFDAISGTWHQKQLDFERYKKLSLYGRLLRVMEKAELISYKRKLARQVDLEDVSQITESI